MRRRRHRRAREGGARLRNAVSFYYKKQNLLVDALLVGRGALVMVFEILVGLVAESSPIPVIPLHWDDQGLEGLKLALDDGGHIVVVQEPTYMRDTESECIIT